MAFLAFAGLLLPFCFLSLLASANGEHESEIFSLALLLFGSLWSVTFYTISGHVGHGRFSFVAGGLFVPVLAHIVWGCAVFTVVAPLVAVPPPFRTAIVLLPLGIHLAYFLPSKVARVVLLVTLLAQLLVPVGLTVVNAIARA